MMVPLLSTVILIIILSSTRGSEFPPQVGNNGSSDAEDFLGSKTEDKCRQFKVLEASGRKFAYLIDRKKANYMIMMFRFMNNTSIRIIGNRQLFVPKTWVWTFKGRDGAYAMLAEPYDVDLLSLGILSRNRAFINLYIQAYPSGCDVIDYNVNGTREALAAAINAYVPPSIREEPENVGLFCYGINTQNEQPTKSILNLMSFGLFNVRGFIAFSCCRDTNGNFLQGENHNNSSIVCDEEALIKETYWLVVLEVCGVICFLYSPLLLRVFSSAKHEMECERFDEVTAYPDTPTLQGYTQISGRIKLRNEATLNRDVSNEGEEDWLYLGIDIPYSLSTVINTILFSRLRGRWASRVRRFLFLLISAAPMIFRILLYYHRKPESLQARLKAGIPVDFLAIPFGFRASFLNWRGWMGGPYILYGVYFTLGSIFLCLPSSLAQLLTHGTREISMESRRNPLFLDLELIEYFSGIPASHSRGYLFLCQVTRGRLYMLLNIDFWKFFGGIWRRRLRRLAVLLNYRKNKTRCSKLAFWLLTFPLWILAFIILALEATICTLYNGLPMLNFLVTVIRKYALYVSSFAISRGTSTSNHCLRKTLLVILNVILTIILFYLFYGFSLLFINTFTFMCQIVNFTLVGIVVNPSSVMGYVAMVTIIVVSVCKSTHNIIDGYLELQKIATKTSEKMQSESKQASVKVKDGNLVITTNGSLQHYDKIVLDGTPVEHQLTVDGSRPVPELQYVRYRDDMPGIPRSLFDRIVQKHRPLRVELFASLVKISVILLFVNVTLSAINAFDQYQAVSSVSQVIAAIFLGVLPQLLGIYSSPTYSALKEEQFQNQLKVTITQYWERVEELSMSKVFIADNR